MDRFVATYINRLDSKGRVSVPAAFRAVLAREGHEGLYCYPALDLPAIDAGGARLQDEIGDQLTKFDTFSEEYEVLSTAFYADSRVLKIDQDGRIMLPEEFREVTGIGDAALFAGQGFKFQIWEESRFRERHKAAREHLRSLKKSLGRKAGADDAQGSRR